MRLIPSLQLKYFRSDNLLNIYDFETIKIIKKCLKIKLMIILYKLFLEKVNIYANITSKQQKYEIYKKNFSLVMNTKFHPNFQRVICEQEWEKRKRE